jgi:hypothetical protein
LMKGWSSLMMEAVRTSETSVDNNFTLQYIPEDNSEHHTRRRENLKSHILKKLFQREFKNVIIKGQVCVCVCETYPQKNCPPPQPASKRALLTAVNLKAKDIFDQPPCCKWRCWHSGL